VVVVTGASTLIPGVSDPQEEEESTGEFDGKEEQRGGRTDREPDSVEANKKNVFSLLQA
jgi:hypothetical protein